MALIDWGDNYNWWVWNIQDYDDNNISLENWWSSQKINEELLKKANKAINWEEGEILIKDINWHPVNSWKKTSDFAPSWHQHISSQIQISTNNFWGVLNNEISNLQKLADFIDDNIGFGRSLQFDWNGTQLGIRQEWDTNYTYTDIQWEVWKGLEFNWNGTQLWVRVAWTPTYSYVDLEWPKATDGIDWADWKSLEFSWNWTKLWVRKEWEPSYIFKELKWETGNGILDIQRTSGNGTPWTTDTYTITYTDNSTDTFTVTNGANGEGAMQTVSTPTGDLIQIDSTDPANPVFSLADITESDITDLDKYTQTEVDAKDNLRVAISDIIDNATSTDVDKPLSANQGKVLKDLIDNLNSIVTSDDVSLDDIQEIVDYIKQNRTDLQTLSVSNIAWLQSALDTLQANITSNDWDITTLQTGKANLAWGNNFTGNQLIEWHSVWKDASGNLLIQSKNSEHIVYNTVGSWTNHYFKTNWTEAFRVNASWNCNVFWNLNLSGILNGASFSSYDKIRLWSNSSYTIGMNDAMTFWGLNDFAMTFTMNPDTDRWFIWRDDAMTKSDWAMALTTEWKLTTKNSIAVWFNGVPTGNLANGKSIVIGDSDTWFRQEWDWVIQWYANNQKIWDMRTAWFYIKKNVEIYPWATSRLTMLHSWNWISEVNLHWSSQWGGRVYVWQTISNWWGIEYDGSSMPWGSWAWDDYTALYRRKSGTDTWVARWNYGNDYFYMKRPRKDSASLMPTDDRDLIHKKYFDDNAWSFPRNVYVSSVYSSMADNTIYTITHNLWINSTDVRDGRYTLHLFARKDNDNDGSTYWGDHFNSAMSDDLQAINNYWSSSSPASWINVNWQANSVKAKLENSYNRYRGRFIIRQNW